MKIICVGNRYIAPDGAALWLYDDAIKQTWPNDIEWIEGGLGGLNLSPYFETEDNILLVDYLPNKKNAMLFSLAQLMKNKVLNYNHATALYYLLQTLPEINLSLPNINIMSCCPSAQNWQQQLYRRIHQHIKSYEQVR